MLILYWKPTSDFLLVVKRNETPICIGLGDIGRYSITGSDVMPISPLGAPNFKSDLIFWKPTSDFLLLVKKNQTPICKGLGVIDWLTHIATSRWADWVRGKSSNRGIESFHQHRELNVSLQILILAVRFLLSVILSLLLMSLADKKSRRTLTRRAAFMVRLFYSWLSKYQPELLAFFYNRKWRHADFTARGRQISNPTSYSESPIATSY